MALGILLTSACPGTVCSAKAVAGMDTWFGPQLAFPVPAQDIGESPLGFDAGVTLTGMKSSYVGMGMDLVYHYWPASPGYKAAFDQYLRNTRAELIDSPNWAFGALQMTVHVKLVAPMMERHGAWLQIGGGMYRVNRNIAEPNWEGSPSVFMGLADNIEFVPGWYGSVGFDVRTSSNTVLGLDATFHHIQAEHEDIPEFSAFTVGTHFLFGW